MNAELEPLGQTSCGPDDSNWDLSAYDPAIGPITATKKPVIPIVQPQ